MELTYEQAQEIRQGIMMGRRNFENNCDAPYDSQTPTGKLRLKAYARTWVRCLYGVSYYPPKASSTKRNFRSFAPSVEEQLEAMSRRVRENVS